MSQPMESDEPPHPKQVGLLRPQAVVAVTDSLPHLVEQAERSQRRTRAWFHGWLIPRPRLLVSANLSAFQVLMCCQGASYLSPC